MFNAQGRTTAAVILRVFAFFHEHPEGCVRTGLWDSPEWDRAQFLTWFRRCLDRKINRHDARRWRCLTDDWQSHMVHDARLINDAARGIRWCGRNLLLTPEMRRRYPHINMHDPDD